MVENTPASAIPFHRHQPQRPALIPLLIVVLPLITAVAAAAPVQLGVEVLLRHHLPLIKGKRVALLVGATSLDESLRHTVDLVGAHALLTRIFTGDAYFRPTMTIEGGGGTLDAMTQAPVTEVLDPLSRPDPALLQGTELLMIDVQDIGLRYFNYVTLLAQFLDLARETKVPVMILDRPNPINARTISGPVLEVSHRSQFGVYPIPLVYGMTLGELGLMFNKAFGLGARLTVIGMENYQRNLTFDQTGRHWAMPSDHLPEAASPRYYAITGFLGEMGILSTGVGYTRPFHYILAPWIDGERLASDLNGQQLPGVRFLSTTVRPYYGLFQQKQTPGVEVVITDPVGYDPVLTGVAIIKVLAMLYPDRVPLDHPAIRESLDTLLGGPSVRQAVAQGLSSRAIWQAWQPKLQEFRALRQKFLIYQN